MTTPLVSVIIPTNPEREGTRLEKTLANLSQTPGVEIICVDYLEAPTRAERLHRGFEKSSGLMIVFHHPRSQVSQEGIQYLLDHAQDKTWGGFTHMFDKSHWILRFTSWYSNKVRSRLAGIIYLDHCIFFHRSLYTESIPAVPVFEDTLLCHQLREYQKPVILPFHSVTSAVRFEKNGLYWQSFMNQLMKIGFYLGVPYDTMNKFYEKGLNLNSEYKN